MNPLAYHCRWWMQLKLLYDTAYNDMISYHCDGLVEDYSNSIVNALELL